jgi:hypothetical protein
VARIVEAYELDRETNGDGSGRAVR